MSEPTVSKTFEYVKYNAHTALAQEQFKKSVEAMERMILTLAPGRARSLAQTQLEVTYMWIGKALRDEQVALDEAAKSMAELPPSE